MRKMQNKLTHETVLKVTGNQSFPIDMLRYDSCFPENEEDANAILASTYESNRFEIHVKKHTSTAYAKGAVWSLERWRSYGCEIEVIV